MMKKKLNLDLVKKVKLYIQEFKVMIKDNHYLGYKKVKEEDNYKVPINIKESQNILRNKNKG